MIFKSRLLFWIFLIAFGSYSHEAMERIVTTSYEYIDGRCCMKNCLEAENAAECQAWKDSLVGINRQQEEITEERVAKLEATYQEIVELRRQAEENRNAKLDELRKQLNATWQVRKVELKEKLAAEVERVRQACLNAREIGKKAEATAANECIDCGTTDTATLESTVDQSTTLEDTPQTVQATSATPPTSASISEDSCDVIYNNYCYLVIVLDSIYVDYSEAESICKEHESEPASFQDKTHYTMIIGVLTVRIPDGDEYARAWTGIRYDPMTGATTTDGDAAAFIKWYIWNPNTAPGHTHVYILTEPGPTDGMLNIEPSYKTSGVICQKITDISTPTPTVGQLTTLEDTSQSTPVSSVETITSGRVSDGSCGVLYNTSCYRMVVYNAKTINFTVAEEICNSSGSEPAVIQDQAHYDLIVEYLRDHLPDGSDFVEAWTGVYYDPSNGSTTTANGDVVAFIAWAKYQPSESADFTRIYVRASLYFNASDQGMYNIRPSYFIRAVICQNLDLCEISYQGSCFFVKYSNKREEVRETSYAEAEELCAKHGAKPANVYSETHYNQLADYMRPSIPAGQSSIQAWLGMTIDPEVPSYSLSNGDPAPYLVWYRLGSDIYPRTGSAASDRTGISLHIARDPSRGDEGMFNFPPTYGTNGVICEI